MSNYYCDKSNQQALKMDNFYSCLQRCRQNKSCSWIGWNIQTQKCVLFANCRGIHFKEGWNAVPKKCPKPGSGCFYDNFMPKGLLTVKSTVNDVFECQAECKKKTSCVSFAMKKTDGLCSFSYDHGVSFDIFNKYMISGPQNCTSKYFIYH